MKICPLCHTTYEDWIDFCFSDGMPLVAKGGASSPLPVKPSSVGASIAPRLAEGADLPSPGALRPAPPVRADEPPARAAPPEPPSDITGIFTGSITDDDGDEFRRLPPPRQSLNLAGAGLPAESDSAATRPMGSLPDMDSDEQSRATVPLSSSALGAHLLAAETQPLVSPAAPAPAVQAAPEHDVPSIVDEPAAPAAVVAERAEPAMRPEPATRPEPRPEPVKFHPAAPSVLDSEPPSSGGLGIGLVVAGVLGVGVLIVAVLAAGAFFMGGKDPVQTVAVAAPAPPPPPAPVAPPPVVEPTPEVLPDVAVAPPLPVATPPSPVPAVPPPTAAPVAATTPVKPPPAPTAVAKPPPATPTSVPASTTADADPWGAPVATTSGVLKIVTDPDGGTVYIDEQQRGKTPLTVELAYGVHNIRVVRSGYKTEVRDVTIRVAELNVPFILKPEVVTGQVNVYGPSGFRVFIDGHDRGAMPVTVQVSEGVRQFKLVSDADGTGCSLPKEIAFRSPGRPETVTLICP